MATTRPAGEIVLSARGVVKRYGGVNALDGVDFELRSGEIHAVVGENGAGKSTLVKILSGVLAPDEGLIEVDGAPTSFASAREAASRGVAIVSQELSMFGDLSVRENLFPYDPPRIAGILSTRRARRRAEPVLAELGLRVPPTARVGDLPLAEAQLLEIGKALLHEPRVLILDEPTSALPSEAVERLKALLRRLVSRGIAVLYISHFLEEVLQLAHRVTVLRDGGTVVDGGAVGSVNLDSLVTAMLGAAAHEPRAAERARASTGDGTAPVVRFDSVDAGTLLQRVSFDVPAGQIAGLTGLQGAGHLAALEVLTGRRRPDAGIVRVAGRTRPRSLRRAIRGGIAFVSSDRKRYGLMLDKPVWLNVSAVSWLGIGRNGPWLRQRRLTEEARRQTDRLRVAGGPLAITADLSGGNQQKVVFAKWLTAEPDVVVLDDPTRGVDVGARLEMHEIINAVAAEGRTVLLASTDLTELSQLCHRVLVFQRGRLVADLDREELSEQAMSVAMNAGFIEADPA